MPKLPTRIAFTTLLITLVSSGCSYYQKYDYGKVAGSRLDKALVTPIDLPVSAPSISQRFRPVGVSSQNEHKGFDIIVPDRTPVLAAAGGEVSRVARSILFGNQIILNHGRNAVGYRIQTRYFHLDQPLVIEGEKIRRGQLVGYTGATGLAGVFPHLHFEVHRLNEAVAPIAFKFLDPQLFWVDGVGKITCYDNRREYSESPVRLTYPVPCREIGWQ